MTIVEKITNGGMIMKIALVTGGSRGLGKSAAIALARKGVGIVFTYNQNQQAANKTIEEIKSFSGTAYSLQLDTQNVATFDSFSNDLKELISEKFQRQNFDYLLNNAGIGKFSPITDMKERDFDELVNIHLKGVYFLTQKLIPLISEGGRILNVSSGLTRFSYPGYSAYASIKGAIEVFTRYLALELGEKKISVNCIAPGAIETDFGGGQVRDNKDLNNLISGQTPLGRVGLPQDIGPIMAEILAGDMGWINGQRIEASGGIHG